MPVAADRSRRSRSLPAAAAARARRPGPGLVLAAVLGALPAGGHAQGTGAGAGAPAPVGVERRFDDLRLTLRFPASLHLVAKPTTSDDVRGSWTGQLGAAQLRVDLQLLDRAAYGIEEPDDVVELIADDLAQQNRSGGPGGSVDEVSHPSGPFGCAPYAALARGSRRDPAGAASQVFWLCGLLEASGYVLEVAAQPALADADGRAVRDALSSAVLYDGPKRDGKWTDAECRQRWHDSVPDPDEVELDDILRTAHYVVLTNSSGGKTFAKKMEECYAAIRKVYPFEELPERRLMPVFLFRTNDEYYAFFAKAFGATVEDGKRSGGVSSADFYATWYEAPGDPVHIHEATHQIFRNRLGLGGAGSWFQEGVAQYMSTKANERGSAARAVKKGRHVPLAQFFRVESLLFSAPSDDKSGGDEAADQYEQAALLIEFLRESKFGKERFQEFLHAVGRVSRNDVPAIEAALRAVYGVDVAGLEQQFTEYCRKR